MTQPSEANKSLLHGAVRSKKFWIILVVVLVALTAFIVVMSRWAADDRAERLEQLNDHYVEKIEFETRRGSSNWIVIDGTKRLDCVEEEGGWLECEDDPQPTLESDQE